jgi:hypothetical protein
MNPVTESCCPYSNGRDDLANLVIRLHKAMRLDKLFYGKRLGDHGLQLAARKPSVDKLKTLPRRMRRSLQRQWKRSLARLLEHPGVCHSDAAGEKELPWYGPTAAAFWSGASLFQCEDRYSRVTATNFRRNHVVYANEAGHGSHALLPAPDVANYAACGRATYVVLSEGDTAPTKPSRGPVTGDTISGKRNWRLKAVCSCRSCHF